MFYQILEKLCSEMNTTPTAFVINVLGMGSSNVTRWKKGTSPNSDVAIKIANYFNVTLDYLLLGKDTTSVEVKKNIVNHNNFSDYFYKLSDRHKDRILERIETYLEEEVYEIKSHNLYGSVAAESEQEYNEKPDKTKVTIKHIPIYGQTAAGPPIDIVEVGGGYYIAVPETADADYALIVKGDSMSPKIADGDIVFIKDVPDMENGTIGVFDINGTVTCKKIHKTNSHIELISFNKNYEPIILTPKEDLEFRIIGKVSFCQGKDGTFFTA